MLSTNNMMTTILVAAALLAGTYFGHKFQTKDYSSAKSTEHGTSLDASRLRLLESRIEHLTVTVEELVGRQTSDSASNKDVELHLRVSELADSVEQLSDQFYSFQSDHNHTDYKHVNSATDIEDFTQDAQAAAGQQNAYLEMLSIAMADEEVDDAWSSNVTTMLHDTFHAPEFEAGQLVSSDCRSTMCRVEILFDNSQNDLEVASFENKMLIQLASELPKASIIQKNSPDGRRTVAYFARKGHGLPSSNR